MAIYSTASLLPPALHSFHPYFAFVDSQAPSNSERGRVSTHRNHSTRDGLPLVTLPLTRTRPLPNIPEPPCATTQMAMKSRESFDQGQYTSTSPSSSPSWHPQEFSVLPPQSTTHAPKRVYQTPRQTTRALSSFFPRMYHSSTFLPTIQNPSILGAVISHLDWVDVYPLFVSCKALRDLSRNLTLRDTILARYVPGYAQALGDRDMNHYQHVHISIHDLDLLCTSVLHGCSSILPIR